MDLGAKHHRGEDEEEEALKAQEDEEDDSGWRGEGTALWGQERRGNTYSLNTHTAINYQIQGSFCLCIIICIKETK